MSHHKTIPNVQFLNERTVRPIYSRQRQSIVFKKRETYQSLFSVAPLPYDYEPIISVTLARTVTLHDPGQPRLTTNEKRVPSFFNEAFTSLLRRRCFPNRLPRILGESWFFHKFFVDARNGSLAILGIARATGVLHGKDAATICIRCWAKKDARLVYTLRRYTNPDELWKTLCGPFNTVQTAQCRSELLVDSTRLDSTRLDSTGRKISPSPTLTTFKRI